MKNAPSGTIITPSGLVRGRLRLSERIESVVADPTVPERPWLIPGFVDLHVHGGDGADTMDGADPVLHLARFHARHGTTTLLPTTVTAPTADIERAFVGIGEAMRAAAADGARLAGAHLEGPFINPKRLGAQPPFAILPDLELVRRLHASAPIRVATVAPEIDADRSLLQLLLGCGCRVQIGHSDATAEIAAAALAGGYAGITHLFNAMSPFTHRAPGVAGTALAIAQRAEIILDLMHVDALAAKAAFRAVPGLYAITDAVAAAGRPPGTYHLGTQTIETDGRSARLADGTLAGSVLTMDQALRNLTGPLGRDLPDAVLRTSTLAADYLGDPSIGRIQPGARADVVALDDALQVQAVWIGGREVDLGA